MNFQIKVQTLAFYSDVCTAPNHLFLRILDLKGLNFLEDFLLYKRIFVNCLSFL